MNDLVQLQRALGLPDRQMAAMFGLSVRGYAYRKAGTRGTSLGEQYFAKILLNIVQHQAPLQGLDELHIIVGDDR